jgi:TonB family protein
MNLKKSSYLINQHNRVISVILLLFVLKANLQAQVTDENLIQSLSQENPRSSMWGQIGNQMLPFFKVNNESFEYPVEAMRNRTQGQVDISFKVNKEGNIIDSTVHIINSLSKSLDEKAIEMIKKSSIKSQWPIFQQSYNSKARYYTTLVFAIQEKHWASFYSTVGLTAYKANDYQEAIRNFNLSVEFDDKNAKTYYSLYRSYLKINNEELACDYLKKAKRLESGYKNEWKSKCR